MNETKEKNDLETSIEQTIEELEEKSAPVTVEKIALNHNETLVRDKGGEHGKG
jgi:hypothetical protein